MRKMITEPQSDASDLPYISTSGVNSGTTNYPFPPVKKTFRLIWSEEDKEYVGLHDDFPYLSFTDTDPQKALKGIIVLVEMIRKDIRKDEKKLWKKAKKLAKRFYTVELKMDTLSSGQMVFFLSHPALPGCKTHGSTLVEAAKNLKGARRDYIWSLLCDNLEVPFEEFEDEQSQHYYRHDRDNT